MKRSSKASFARARLIRDDAAGGATGTAVPPRRVAPPLVCELAICFAVSCGTAFVSGGFPLAFFPPLKATHAPPAARSTTRPIAAGTSGRFFAAAGDGAGGGGGGGGGRFAEIRWVAPPAVGSRIWVLASVCGTALVTGRPVTAATSAA